MVHKSSYRHERKAAEGVTRRRTDTDMVRRAGRKNHKDYP